MPSDGDGDDTIILLVLRLDLEYPNTIEEAQDLIIFECHFGVYEESQWGRENE